MSFFKDFKEDLSQAVSELMPSEEEMLAKLEEKENTEKPTDIGEEFIIPEEEPVGGSEDVVLNETAVQEEFVIPEEEETTDSTEEEELVTVPENADVQMPEEKIEIPEEMKEVSEEGEESEEDAFFDSEMPEDEYEEEIEVSGEPVELEEDNGTDAMFGEFVKGMLEKLEAEKPADAKKELETIPETPETPETLEAEEPMQEEDLFAELHAEEIVLEEEDLTLEDFMKENGIIEETVEQEENTMTMETNEMENLVEEEKTIMDDGTPTSEDVAVITKGMRIKGDVESDGSIEVVGDIIGNITCKGKLTISGKVNGNSRAAEIFVNQARIEGEVSSNETVKVGNGTVIIGNISAASAVIAGAVKGDIDVNGPVVVDASAVVMGNIKSRSVQINSGAVIEGTFSQCYNSEVDVQGIFEEK